MRQDKGIGNLVSKTCAGLSISAIKEMAILSAGVPGASSLAWGLPSFQTPETIRKAVGTALNSDPKAGMYTLPAGLAELRDAAAQAGIGALTAAGIREAIRDVVARETGPARLLICGSLYFAGSVLADHQ